MLKILIFLQCFFSFSSYSHILNIPYHFDKNNKKIMHRYIYDFPTSLDPGEVYDNENLFLLGQVYEQLYGYQENQLYPVLASSFPKVTFLNDKKQVISSKDSQNIAYTIYTISIKPHVFYQPHPAISSAREVVAEDFVYAFKRSAFKYVSSPIVNMLAQHVVGFEQFLKFPETQEGIEGIQALDAHTLQIITKDYYAPFINWLAMPFFSPIPKEVDIYNQNLDDKDSWRWSTIGTGAFMIYQDKDYQTIHLKKNPHFRAQYLRVNGESTRLPLIDEIYFHLEKESIPRWNKFLQGYYDYSSIPAETYENVVWTAPDGQSELSPQIAKKNIRFDFIQLYETSGIAFNMQDKVLGQNLYLRRAISIGFQFFEFINIFQNSFVQQAQGPLPTPLIKTLHLDATNPYLFNQQGSVSKRKSLLEARELLKKAGYPNGIDLKTGKPLVLSMDVQSTGKPIERAIFNWYRKQMSQLGIHLQIRENDKNRYHLLINRGQYQMTPFAWRADYPDAENFFMLFYGLNGKKMYSSLNLSNYQNEKFDKLFKQYLRMPHEKDKQKIAQEMYQILIHDSVWAWGTHGQLLFLSHPWSQVLMQNSAYFSAITRYIDLYPQYRQQVWFRENQARWGGLIWMLASIVLILLPFIREWRKINKRPAPRTRF